MVDAQGNYYSYEFAMNTPYGNSEELIPSDNLEVNSENFESPYSSYGSSSFAYGAPSKSTNFPPSLSLNTPSKRFTQKHRQRLINSSSPKKGRYYNRSRLQRARLQRERLDRINPIKENRNAPNNGQFIPSPRQQQHSRKVSPSRSVISIASEISESNIYSQDFSTDSVFSAISVGSVPQHLRPENWHRSSKKKEETLIFRWEISQQDILRLNNDEQIRSVSMILSRDISFRFIFSAGSRNNDPFYAFTIFFEKCPDLDRIIDVTIQTLTLDGQEVLGPTTHNVSERKNVVEGFVINAHNIKYSTLHECIIRDGLCFNIELYVELENNNRMKKSSFLSSLLTVDPIFSDFTLICGTRQWKVHKFILAVYSKVLRTEFLRKPVANEYEIKSVNSDIADSCIKWMYNSESDWKLLEITSPRRILPLAHELQIVKLLDLCIFANGERIDYGYGSNRTSRKRTKKALEISSLLNKYERSDVKHLRDQVLDIVDVRDLLHVKN